MWPGELLDVLKPAWYHVRRIDYKDWAMVDSNFLSSRDFQRIKVPFAYIRVDSRSIRARTMNPQQFYREQGRNGDGCLFKAHSVPEKHE